MKPNAIKSEHQHAWYEDALALLAGPLLISFGLVLYLESKVFTGGLAGLALLLEYGTSWKFGVIFFVLNFPFYILSFMRMGLLFTVKTFIAVTLISVFSRIFANWIDFSSLNPIFASVLGGIMMGNGMLTLFRHRAGVGGFSIFAQFLQDKNIARAGYVMLGFDVMVVSLGIFLLPWKQVLISVLGAVILNVIIGMNHKPGRYAGFS